MAQLSCKSHSLITLTNVSFRSRTINWESRARNSIMGGKKPIPNSKTFKNMFYSLKWSTTTTILLINNEKSSVETTQTHLCLWEFFPLPPSEESQQAGCGVLHMDYQPLLQQGDKKERMEDVSVLTGCNRCSSFRQIGALLVVGTAGNIIERECWGKL